MKHSLILVSLLLLTACGVFAPNAPHKKVAAQVRLTLLPMGEVLAGKPVTVMAKLSDVTNNYVLKDEDLALVHTQKFHLLVIDPTFSDYQHIHPQLTNTPGVYSFTFVPTTTGTYRAWADITPVTTGVQQFVQGSIGTDPKRPGAIDKSIRMVAVSGNYQFNLSFDKPPVSGGESMGTIRVTDKKGKPITSLEPVMGTYAHIVAFSEDFNTVMHTHPMGAEPKADSERAGPEVMFHFEPKKSGFVKLYAQFKIGGTEVFAPFGLNVGEAPPSH